MNSQLLEQTPPVIKKAVNPSKASIGIAIAYCHKDYIQLVRLLKWIGRLGQRATQFNHDKPAHLTLVPSKALPEEIQLHILELAKQVGFDAHNLPPEKIDERGWPGSCSYQFIYGLNRTFEFGFQYCLFIEPDAMPTRDTWLREIQTEWASTQDRPEFQFYGVRVPTSPIMVNKKENPYDEWHMSGIGIYPANHFKLAPKLTASATATDKRFFGPKGVPWDIWAADQTVPKLWRTELFLHRWGKKSDPETDFAGHPNIAVYHQCKDEMAFKSCDKYFHGSKFGVSDGSNPLIQDGDLPKVRKRRFSTKNAMSDVIRDRGKQQDQNIKWSPTKLVGGAWYGEYVTDDPEKIVILTAMGFGGKVI